MEGEDNDLKLQTEELYMMTEPQIGGKVETLETQTISELESDDSGMFDRMEGDNDYGANLTNRSKR